MNIAIVGTGYVGLVSGTCFAETGNNVVCIDIDENKVLRMQNGEVPIYEPGLEVLFERNTKQGRLSFTTDLTEGIKNAEIIFLALPTPPGADGSADLKYVLKVAEHLSHIITDYKVIVDKSTVPVGTADKVYERLAANLDESFFDVVSNPEFLREGVAVDDFMRPERVVIGTSSSKAKKVMERLYNPFVRQGNPVIFMDEKSAEMTKYAANSFLATKITFMNEVANLCEEVGANVDMVRKGIGSDSRIGKRFLFPGVGYGGSCFPKDVKALAKTAQENNCDFRILQSVMDVNEDQKSILSRRIKNYFGESIANKTIGIWGLAFKPNTDDIREAPALTIIDELLKAGAQIKAFDPEAMENVKALMGDKIILCDNQYDAIEGTDALAVVTEWNVFRTPDYDRIMSSLREPVVFDGRNVFDPVDMKERGFVYSSIGRP
ncbi:UDP-glucose/GDP-mannose dehydrogenase family protein [Saprospiraceae bacterium]|nr:UDP-glucose/GDP-mannose dehydrogenase family protein [Saprospiraceae bacterium]MDA9299648.1 UDP-glucose/GDP-mannose dehydrogenase family protein [Saprospiraceae bacterium]MDB4163296.1 UDP-glucose/GDP-mannose dehydrogenase family protein [Saprospiraceae bacterium]MDB4824045.1 UDP-glucose/GDP-mannose dehydrogenase family protein [Saprospiraceae bacterium]MDB9914849.1 UDP-glucose/GDP-mannose dehydrogenase family protein [Saprospiraceae bacterium]